MRSYLLDLWHTIRSSYWFIPSLMSVGAVLLSMASIELDARIGSEAPSGLEWLFNNQPDGARAVLSTIAGSMITVAGVVFSITLVTLSNAASQYGPRLLTNFMRDQTNQVTLGTFIATFLYCLLVLRAVQSAPPGASDAEASYFVPHIALLIGIGFAICSIAVLIRFIHHVPRSIHISLVTSKIGEELCARIQERFPSPIGSSSDIDNNGLDLHLVPETLRDPVDPAAAAVRSKKAGYIRLIDADTLLNVAEDNDAFYRLAKRPGDFVLTGEALVYTPASIEIDEETSNTLRGAFSIGTSRTPVQDMRFLIQELVEIAARALSPGVNDPVTAISSLNWLAAAMISLSNHGEPDALRRGSDGTPRIYAPVLHFDELLEGGFGRLRSYLANDPTTVEAALDLLSRMRREFTNHRADAIDAEAGRLVEAARDALAASSFKEVMTQSSDALASLSAD